MIRIDVVTTARTGFIVAIETADSEPGTGYDWGASGTAMVVGQVYRISEDGEPEKWKAWLWPKATSCPATGQHVQAVTRARFSVLREALRQQAARAPWWGVPPDRQAAEHRERLEQATAERTGRPA